MYRAHTLLREAMFAAGSAASLAVLLFWLGPPGNDLAAHVYQRTVFLHDGFQLWNNFWYGGRYGFVTYSVLYYPLAALFGIKAAGAPPLVGAEVEPAARPCAAARPDPWRTRRSVPGHPLPCHGKRIEGRNGWLVAVARMNADVSCGRGRTGFRRRA